MGKALGVVCTAPCQSGSCPTDAPPDTKNPQPACAIQDQAGNQYCALECGLLGGGCPSAASCSGMLQGICTYPSTTFTTAMSVKADVTVLVGFVISAARGTVLSAVFFIFS